MRRFLVVDDNVTICKLLLEFLTIEHVAEVRCATNSREGARLISWHRFDIAIIDVVLPDMDGISLAVVAAKQGIPVLLMSGHPARIIRLHAHGLPYLSKPFRLSVLRDKANDIMRDPQANIHAIIARTPISE